MSGSLQFKAENEHGLYFSQGNVQAEDCLFQMDLSRRLVSGVK
ncbi:penicillin acylase family protein [Bacillus arachidis]|nr:penicillin acylase family protein [Bacillus arachidis]WIY63626.1 penicillin acylase family protein [Bacillus arachidis]